MRTIIKEVNRQCTKGAPRTPSQAKLNQSVEQILNMHERYRFHSKNFMAFLAFLGALAVAV